MLYSTLHHQSEQLSTAPHCLSPHPLPPMLTTTLSASPLSTFSSISNWAFMVLSSRGPSAPCTAATRLPPVCRGRDGEEISENSWLHRGQRWDHTSTYVRTVEVGKEEGTGSVAHHPGCSPAHYVRTYVCLTINTKLH